jgi:hypothetical protein
MSRSSTTIVITREAHLSAIIQSFSKQFLILFSKFRDSLHVVIIIYYIPWGIEHSRVTKNLRVLIISLLRLHNQPQSVSSYNTVWHFVRLYSPVLDSNVLSGYLSLNTKTKTFIKIIRRQLRHYPVSQYKPPVGYSIYISINHAGSSSGSQTRLSAPEEGINRDFITGITITLKGRIQTESIKPRKTVQSFIVGSHYSTRRQSLVSNTSSITNSNYELGSYSITVKVTVPTSSQNLVPATTRCPASQKFSYVQSSPSRLAPPAYP